MKYTAFTLGVFALIAGSSSFPRSAEKPFWNNLKVKWGIPQIDTNRYDHMPRTVAEAESSPFNLLKISTECINGNTFQGLRYIFPGDYTMGLLYDVNGYIAGIQMILNREEILASGKNNYKYAHVGMFQPEVLDGKNVYTLTTYFVKPETICTTGRSPEDFDTQGTGVQIYFQDGPTINKLITPPTNRADAIAQNWSVNQCLFGMGWHNFYNVESFDADQCTTVRPVFLLFDKKDQLKAFGFVAFGDATSIRYEKPSSTAIKAIVGSPTPKCLSDLADQIKVSSMHVFFTENPELENCIRS